MFGTIRRHQTWLWAVIITITVVSFVVFFNPNAKYAGNNSGRVNLGSISGEPVTREDYRAALAEVQISYFLGHGDWPDHDPAAKQNGFNVEREIYQRLFLVQKQKDLNVHVSREAIGNTAAQVLHSMGREGSSVPLDVFEKQVLQPRGLNRDDFARMLEHELGVRQMIAALGLSGRLTTPQEAEMLFRREHEEISAEAVFFSANNYLGEVKVTPGVVGQFFTNQMARYRVPDCRQVSYLKFKSADFLADADHQLAGVSNLTAQVDAIYQQRGTNFYKDLSPADAKKQIREEFRNNSALRFARNKAADFADELMNQSPAQLDNLEKLAAQKGFTAEISAPFAAEAGPLELEVPAGFAIAAFKLTADEPFAGPIVAEKAVYVIGLRKVIPSEIPPFDSIRAKVEADYQLLTALQIARSSGTNFAQAVTTAAAGKAFADLCADAKLTPVKLPAFSLASRSLPEVENHINFGRLQEIAYGMPVGSNTGFVPTSEGGVILHILARSPVSDAALKAEQSAFLAQVRQTRQGEAFNAWFGREAQTALRDTPLSRPATIGAKP